MKPSDIEKRKNSLFRSSTLAWRVYAVCSGVAGLIGIGLATTRLEISIDRITLFVLGVFCVVNAVRFARFKQPADDGPRDP